LLNPDDIEKTERLIRPFIRRTPTLRLAAADLGVRGAELALKFEYMQHGGSFKARGAFSNLLQRDISDAGVVAASGGNHGAAVALAAHRVGTKATIFVPSVSSPAKRAQIESFGADLRIVGERYDDALNASDEFTQQTGAVSIHAFDQIETLSGQGTVAMEFEQQGPDFDTLLVSVGGGGFIGGIAGWFRDRVNVIGVEPEMSPTLHNALAAGNPVDAPAGGVAADSLAPRRVGDLMFPLAQRYVEKVILVADQDILAAQRSIWQALRVVVEPGAAATVAALQSGRYVAERDERVAMILCGANVTGVQFATADTVDTGT